MNQRQRKIGISCRDKGHIDKKKKECYRKKQKNKKTLSTMHTGYYLSGLSSEYSEVSGCPN